MKWPGAMVRELLGLFVDDVPFTLGIVAWVGIGALGLPRLPIDGYLRAPILFLGCALILVVSTRWTARRPAPPGPRARGWWSAARPGENHAGRTKVGPS